MWKVSSVAHSLHSITEPPYSSSPRFFSCLCSGGAKPQEIANSSAACSLPFGVALGAVVVRERRIVVSVPQQDVCQFVSNVKQSVLDGRLAENVHREVHDKPLRRGHA